MSKTTRVMRAVKPGTIRQGEGRPRLMIRPGVTTAHAGHPIVESHPHLWEEIKVDFPYDDLVGAAADDVNLPHTQALRDLLGGLVERGYALPDPDDVPADEVPDMIVRIVLNNLPQVGPSVNESGPAGPVVEAYDPPDLVEPDDEVAPVDEESQVVVDETTKEGRAAIREWAEDHGYEVHASGPIPNEVLEAWRADQGAGVEPEQGGQDADERND